MATEQVYMSAAELAQQFVEDVTLEALAVGDTNPPIEKGGEWKTMSVGLGNIASVLTAYIQAKDLAMNPLEAEGDDLDSWRKWLGLPEVGASKAAGPVTITVSGVGTIPAGQQITAPNGLTATVISGASKVSGAVAVDAEMNQTGSAGNLPAGTQVRLSGGPPNLQVSATIPSDWVGGNEIEDDARKRERVLSRLRSANAGWGALRDKALAATGAVGDAFVYWALGGPGSVKAVVTSNTSAKTRQVPEATRLAIESYLANAYPVGTWALSVQSALDAPTDVEISIGLPSTGSRKWLASGPIARTTVTSAYEETSFTIASATTLGNLSPGETIACWDTVNLTAATAKVVSISGTTITTTVWSNGGGPNPSQGRTWIFPACDGLQTIVDTWLKIMLTLSPGENVATTSPVYKFAARLPGKSAAKPMNLSSVQLLSLQATLPEASDIAYKSPPASVTIPPSRSSAPYVLTQHNFAIYPL
jgi:hypothetical protein